MSNTATIRLLRDVILRRRTVFAKEVVSRTCVEDPYTCCGAESPPEVENDLGVPSGFEVELTTVRMRHQDVTRDRCDNRPNLCCDEDTSPFPELPECE